MLEHPAITEIRRKGYLTGYEEEYRYCTICGKAVDEYIFRDKHSGEEVGCDRCVEAESVY